MLFKNCNKPGTALIKTAQTGESLYFHLSKINFNLLQFGHCSALIECPRCRRSKYIRFCMQWKLYFVQWIYLLLTIISDKLCYIPDWTKKGFTDSIRIKVQNEERCSTHMHKTEFTTYPNLRNVICAKDIKNIDIITKKTNEIPAEMVSEYI